jgi:hypothetical protein
MLGAESRRARSRRLLVFDKLTTRIAAPATRAAEAKLRGVVTYISKLDREFRAFITSL